MFRSQSGPGALSINTASANSLPTQSSLPPPSSGNSLFGSTSTSQPQKLSLFGSSTVASQPQATSSIFGASQTQIGGTSQPQPGVGLFGTVPNNTQSTGGGLFGSQQLQPSSNSIFGQTQPQTSTGLFGSTLGQAPNQQPSNSFFGASSNQNKLPVYGNPQPPLQAQQSTMHPAPPASLFSATIGQQTQQQQTVPGVRISVNELRPTTRFNDLHEELQKVIEYVDSFILNQMQWKDSCENEGEMIDNMCLSLPPDVEYCTKQLDTLQQALENDAESIAFSKAFITADAADAKLSFKVIQNLRLPQQFHQTSLWSTAMTPQKPRANVVDDGFESGASHNLVEYFSKQVDSLSRNLNSYKRKITEVEDYLKGIESNTMQQMHQLMFTRGQEGNGKSAEDQVKDLAAVLRSFENGIVGVAAKVGGAREHVQDVMQGMGVLAA